MIRILDGPRGRSPRALLTTIALAALLIVAPTPVVLTTPASAAPCPCSIWSTSQVPAQPSDPDTGAVELGTKFRSDVTGFVNGVRFYKGSANTGTHVGHLWTRGGTRLATVTFTNETASGWQTAMFPSPVSISANTSYIISYFAPNGRYANDDGYFANSGVDNAPLHALRDGVDGFNGLYRYSSTGGFPVNGYLSTNYWVDVLFDTAAADTTPPTVSSTSPAAGATGVPPGTTVAATFNEPIQNGTALITVTNPASQTVPGTMSYNPTTRTATFTPSGDLAVSTTYTARATGAKDLANNVMAPFTWTFTTSTGSGCPCSIWASTTVPAIPSFDDNSAIEVGVRFRTSTPGFVTRLRFYKGAQNTGLHTGSLWTNTGTRLSTVTYSGESATGWQTASLPAPVAVAANTTYVASYHTDVGFYAATSGQFSSAVARGPLTALADGFDGANGVYLYGGGGFPTNTFGSTNYWVDVVFDTNGTDTVAPTVVGRAPAPGSVGVSTGTRAAATFSEPVTSSSIVMTLTGPSGNVAGTVAYDAPTTTATFTPNAALSTTTSYTVNVSGATDPAGNPMSPTNWSFTTGTAPPPPPDQGPGGPVLVIRSSSGSASQFTPFAAEILRTEGLNEFAVADISTVTATTLNSYSVVLLGQMPLTAAQVTMLTNWVTAGGNLIAFRPDAQLASLLGLSAPSGTLAEGYLLVNTAQAPGAGISNQTMQYHGTADRYSLSGATSVATLYSNATTATTNPAVTMRSVGTSGGQAAAFAYDLPRSILYTRQGNTAWDGLERDGQTPIRSDDLYFGGGSPDWVNLNKVGVPQADEQQRLLSNMIESMNTDKMPLPKFWYFPRSGKAVVVATGDDHANGGTPGRFDQYTANSQAGCVVANWECLRFSSYVYTGTPLTNAQALAYHNNGFELGLHPANNCVDYTPASLANDYTTQLSQWVQKYTSLPAPTTNRYHCIVWSDWSGQPTVEGNNGIRFDTNYYYWPGSWVNNRPGFMTGSGMPMRFTDKFGTFINVYQAHSHMTDESDQTYPFTPDALLDAATGPLGYYGAFTANMHTDNATTFQSDQLMVSAISHGVPLVSSKQMLTWLDGRNSSSFANLSWGTNTLNFTVNVGTGANGLTGMVPTAGRGGTVLTGLTRGGSAVSFTRTTIKGVEYAMFLASAGAHVATYAVPAKPPAITATVVRATAAGSATVDVTSPGATGGVEVAYGLTPATLSGRAVDATQGTAHSVTLSGLLPSTTYYYRVTARGTHGKATTSAIGTLVTDPVDALPPVISNVRARSLPDGTAAVRWRTVENSDAALLIGTAPNALVTLYAGELDNVHTVVATHLTPGTTYHYRVRSMDAAGNVTVFPPQGTPPLTFVSSATGVSDQDTPQFRFNKGTTDTYLQSDDLGELTLAPAAAEEFSDDQLPADWEEAEETPGSSKKFRHGKLLIDGRNAGMKTKFKADNREMAFRAIFDGPGEQWVGMAVGNGNGNGNDGALFGIQNGVIQAASLGVLRQTIPLPNVLPGVAHEYRIKVGTATMEFIVDGVPVGVLPGSKKPMRLLVRDIDADGHPLVVDWTRVSGDVTNAQQISRILDAHQFVTWDRIDVRADLPQGAQVRISVRTGSISTPDASWTPFTVVGNGGRVGTDSRYLQYRVELITNRADRAPVLRDIAVSHNGDPFDPPTEYQP